MKTVFQEIQLLSESTLIHGVSAQFKSGVAGPHSFKPRVTTSAKSLCVKRVMHKNHNSVVKRAMVKPLLGALWLPLLFHDKKPFKIT